VGSFYAFLGRKYLILTFFFSIPPNLKIQKFEFAQKYTMWFFMLLKNAIDDFDDFWHVK